MKKIPTLLLRDPNNRAKVLNEVNPLCQWVLDGEGVATRKFDGTCVMQDMNGKWWARREVKPGKDLPNIFLPVDHDPVTKKSIVWVPIEESPFYKFFEEALLAGTRGGSGEGTYELVGPKVNGNPEGLAKHNLIRHGSETIHLPKPISIAQIRLAVFDLDDMYGYEGIVWYHPDGRMAKLKARDL